MVKDYIVLNTRYAMALSKIFFKSLTAKNMFISLFVLFWSKFVRFLVAFPIKNTKNLN